MTKTLYILSALAGLLLAGGCQREGLECVGGAETVSYTVQVPECLAVKAGAGDGFTVYYEVYRDGDLDEAGVAPVYEGQEEFVDGTATLDLKFAKEQDYTVLFWAQKTAGVTAYDIDDLRDVQLNVGALKTNDLNADAFAGKDHVHDCASAAGGNVSLVRPVAQLSVAAATGAGSAQLQSSQMKVSGLFTSLNIATNAVSNGAELTYAQAPLPEEDADPAYTPVVMNHIGFIPTDGAQLTIDFTFQAAGGMSKDLTVSNVPVKPNYKTNITLQETAVLAEGETAVLDLNGFTLSNQGGSKMTINGNVKVTNGIYNTEATLIIKGGEFAATGTNKVLVAYNSTVTIDGGTFTGDFLVSGGTLTDNRNKL